MAPQAIYFGELQAALGEEKKLALVRAVQIVELQSARPSEVAAQAMQIDEPKASVIEPLGLWVGGTLLVVGLAVAAWGYSDSLPVFVKTLTGGRSAADCGRAHDWGGTALGTVTGGCPRSRRRLGAPSAAPLPWRGLGHMPPLELSLGVAISSAGGVHARLLGMPGAPGVGRSRSPGGIPPVPGIAHRADVRANLPFRLNPRLPTMSLVLFAFSNQPGAIPSTLVRDKTWNRA